MCCEEQLRTMGLSGLEKRRPKCELEEEAEREMLISSPWYPMTGLMGMAQSCIRGGSD